ncbi:TIR domain-containing protein [Seohaeicola saemankumensis]|uniref:toll/interleukin-1 receptor domain-containing protein n=1 Tax=Seohaeicola saemankumensis TaxID=481181 RepID=UPI001E2B5E3A|nr:toll/interleukin-1 receptor domain-containing protein [Seohaeicola saemankumensis]MCD1626812.1 TIR domain-containing protein [Seohaeicola saemankumensis]
MRAFLSHSSLDKGYVEAVVENLRPGQYELDAHTFEEAGLNGSEILKSLNRSDLFCLFLSKNAIDSGYVNFEIAFGAELIASGKIERLLTICLDEEVFQDAQKFIKHYNMIRKPRSPESAARLIEGKLISARYARELSHHPFVGREEELRVLEKQANDLTKPRIKALYVSGNTGAGRRTIAKKFYQNQYPQVGIVSPHIELDSFEGFDDIYRAMVSSIRPSISITRLRDKVVEFADLDENQKAKAIADEINALLPDREVLYVFDSGGLLRDDGSLQPEFDEILNHIEDKPFPPVVFLSSRMIPHKLRRNADDLAYLSVSSLNREDTGRIISGLLKEKGIHADLNQVESLIDMADQHPFNIYRMIDLIKQSSVDLFLAEPRDFIDWKHKQTSEYLRSAQLSNLDFRILAIFSIAPELDFASLTEVIPNTGAEISASIQNMLDLHIVRTEDERISISPALRIASERDPRTELKGDERTKIMRHLAESLVVKLEDGEAPISLLDSAILASLEGDKPTSKLMEAFILPSHRVWLAKRHYDMKRWKDSIRMAREALEGRGRLSRSGAVAACRYLGLAAARVNDQETFRLGISQLRSIADDNWSKSNVHFLEGFNHRLQGKLYEAREELLASYGLARGNRSTARELASICLSLELPQEAETYAREAYETSRSNPYIIDILISCLIKNKKRSCVNDSEVAELLASLEKIDEEEGRSFHATRLAEIEYLYGDNRKALKLIQDALKKTPRLFDPLRLYSKILLKDGNLSRAKDQINFVQKIVFDKSAFDLRANHRPYLQLLAEYHIELGEYGNALDVYRNNKLFTEADVSAMQREIETLKALAAKKR